MTYPGRNAVYYLPWSGCSYSTYPDRNTVSRHAWSERSFTARPDRDAVLQHALVGTQFTDCLVIKPANSCHLIPSNRFLDGFLGPSQFAAATLTHYSTISHRPSDFSRPRQCLLLSGDVQQNPGPTTNYPCSVCIRNITICWCCLPRPGPSSSLW